MAGITKGLVARMDNSGLGNQTWELYRHLGFDRIMLIDFSANKQMRNFPERYTKGEIMRVTGFPSPTECDVFVSGLDLIFSCETPYSHYLLQTARDNGVKSIIQPNYELSGWLNLNVPKPTALAIPSNWHYDDFPGQKLHLPVPIATEHFSPRQSDSAKKFLHIAGIPAVYDRNGTEGLVEALQFVTTDIELTICCQKDNYMRSLLMSRDIPRNVRVVVSQLNPDNYWDLYTGFDVLIMPRRFGGLCLPVNEALAAGMPAIMPNISPNNSWLSSDWLFPAEVNLVTSNSTNKIRYDVYRFKPQDLAAKIDQFAKDPAFYQLQASRARAIAKDYSWDSLKPLYIKTFNTMIKK